VKVLLLALLLVVLPEAASAQMPDLGSLLPPGNGSTSGRIIQLMALLTVLSVAPGLLIMVTSFTRFAVALSFLRAGLGLQTTPANLVLISLALFMTLYVMAPTFDRAWETGLQPLMKNEISEEEAFQRISDPFREFMLAHVREKGPADIRGSRRGKLPQEIR
jgi:flagellar biosynthesis protein FliP